MSASTLSLLEQAKLFRYQGNVQAEQQALSHLLAQDASNFAAYKELYFNSSTSKMTTEQAQQLQGLAKTPYEHRIAQLVQYLITNNDTTQAQQVASAFDAVIHETRVVSLVLEKHFYLLSKHWHLPNGKDEIVQILPHTNNLEKSLAFLLLAMYEQQDNETAYLHYLNESIAACPMACSMTRLLKVSHLLQSSSNYTACVQELEAILQCYPHHEQAKLVYANVLHSMNKTSDAIALLNQVLQHNPKNSQVYRLLVQLQMPNATLVMNVIDLALQNCTGASQEWKQFKICAMMQLGMFAECFQFITQYLQEQKQKPSMIVLFCRQIAYYFSQQAALVQWYKTSDKGESSLLTVLSQIAVPNAKDAMYACMANSILFLRHAVTSEDDIPTIQEEAFNHLISVSMGFHLQLQKHPLLSHLSCDSTLCYYLLCLFEKYVDDFGSTMSKALIAIEMDMVEEHKTVAQVKQAAIKIIKQHL